MAEKEERILVAKLGGRNCPVETNDNICLLGCSCESCNGGVSLQDAIERMAKALIRADYPHAQEVIWDMRWKEEAIKDYYLIMAEAALNALLLGEYDD